MIDITEIKQRIQPIAQRYPIRRLALFGSYARGQAQQGSDIDLLVDLANAEFSLFDFIKMKHDIEQVLQTKVDLVEYETLKPRMRKTVLDEQIALL